MAIYGSGAGVIRGEGGVYRQAIGGRIPFHAKEVKTYHKQGGRCKEQGCGQVLSRYNPGEYCSRHESKEQKLFKDGKKISVALILGKGPGRRKQPKSDIVRYQGGE